LSFFFFFLPSVFQLPFFFSILSPQ
jgi:hypothetical protein